MLVMTTMMLLSDRRRGSVIINLFAFRVMNWTELRSTTVEGPEGSRSRCGAARTIVRSFIRWLVGWSVVLTLEQRRNSEERWNGLNWSFDTLVRSHGSLRASLPPEPPKMASYLIYLQIRQTHRRPSEVLVRRTGRSWIWPLHLRIK